jgi:glycosyltransferase involved in cell wall biosynthesis/ribosomal protein S18 acetylase RimI-like enzyme
MSTPRIAHVATVDLTARYLLLPQLLALRDAGFDVSVITADGPHVPAIRAEGIRHIVWPHASRSWDLRSDLHAARELYGIFRRERFDLVHTHNPKPGAIGRVVARMARVPRVVNTVHGLYATPDDPIRKRWSVLGIEWIAARFSDAELYQSHEDLVWARRLGIARTGRSMLLGNGVDIGRFRPADGDPGPRPPWGSGDGPVVGTVGRMVREKGYVEFFEAARRVRQVRPDVRFVVVGERDTDKTDAITEGQIARAGDDVTFLGWRDDVADIMAGLDIFVLASWREGLPRSAVEAAATGIPVVLTDIRGCREVIDDGEQGLLVPVRDPRRLAEAIIRLVDDPAERGRMGEAARRRAIERFDETRVARSVIDVTRRLVGTDRSPRTPASSQDGVRSGRTEDADAMARLHRTSMPTAFLPTLGHGFLRRMYRAMVDDPAAITVVAERDGRVVGFAAGLPSTAAFYRRFAVRHGAPALLAAAPRLTRPDVFRSAVETARYGTTIDGLPSAELVAIAVEPQHRSQGVGGVLVDAVVRRFDAAGAPELKVVVGADNVGANRFYRQAGFRHAAETTVHAGATSNVWVMTTCRS